MSYMKSNLSDSHYGYDMVTSITQASINATMKEWLHSYQGDTFTQAYVYDLATKKPALTDFDALKKRLGFDPFDVPSDPNGEDPHISKMMAEKFMFAFQIEIGLPPFPLDQIPNVVELNKAGTVVTYNMTCKTFKIVTLEANPYAGNQWINLDQSKEKKPWDIQFEVDLNLEKDSVTNKYHLLPEETKDEIKGLGEDMFSVQQLYLDLNSAGLTSQFSIVGIDPKSTAFVYLSSIFLQGYVKEVAKSGGILLGFGVVSSKPFPQSVSLIPTELTFEISPYYDSQGNITQDFPVYTLNYLTMAHDKNMPPTVPFQWNWVDKPDLGTVAGSMAINRNTFADFLSSLLSNTLKSLQMKPSVDVHASGLNMHYSVSTELDSAAKPLYNLVDDAKNPTKVLSYEYGSYDSDHGGTEGLIWGNMWVDYKAHSDVFLEGKEIKVVTNIVTRVHINVEGGTAEGNWVDYSSTNHYHIGVDSNGKLSAIMTQDPLVDHSENPDADWWAKLVSTGEIDSMNDKLKSFSRSFAERGLQSEANEIGNKLNGSSTWVFPGSKTFSFKDAAFSDNQDLISHILYIEPTITTRTSGPEQSKGRRRGLNFRHFVLWWRSRGRRIVSWGPRGKRSPKGRSSC